MRIGYRVQSKTAGSAKTLKADSGRFSNSKLKLRMPINPLMWIQTNLLSETQLQAESAFQKLGEIPLLKAVDYFLTNYREPVQAITIAKAYDSFMDEYATNSTSEKLILQNLKVRVGILRKHFADKQFTEINEDDIRSLIFREGDLSAISRNNDRRAISQFFNWGIKRGFCFETLAKKSMPSKQTRKEPEIMELDDLSALLSAAQNSKTAFSSLHCSICTQASAPPSSSESSGKISTRRTNHHNLRQTSEMRTRRIVQIEPQLSASLIRFKLRKSAIVPANFRNDFNTIRSIAETANGPPMYCGTPQSVITSSNINTKAKQHNG